MLLQERDQDVFKRWILPKLETISDADAEVLADYVVALVSANDSEANIRRNCLESLSDFLQAYTEPFVNDLLKALNDKTYTRAPPATKQQSPVPQPAPIPSIVGTSNSEYEPYPSHITHSPPPGAPKGPAALHRIADRPAAAPASHDISQSKGQSSRKRKLIERETSQSQEGQDSHYGRANGSRPTKQAARKSSRNIRRGGPEPQNGFSGFPQLANLPPPPPGAPPFDPTNPLAMFAFAAAFGLNIPGLPPGLFPNAHDGGSNQQGLKQRCEDYHTKGFCTMGGLCPYEHGDAITIPANDVPEYNPEQSSLALPAGGGSNGQTSRRKQARGGKGGRSRASFSLSGPSFDPSNTTLVIEQIPEDNFSEDQVRTFFSQYGPILNIQLHPYRRLAVVKFEDHDAAERAYRSPKAVFDNRFVKVYWHKSDIDMGEAEAEEEKLDPEEVAKRQAEAQKAFEERRRKAEEAEARAEEIERQLKEKNEEMRKIKQQLAELAGEEAAEMNGQIDKEFSQSLATLQAEAEDLFAQHDGFEAPSARGRGSFRGSYRGRGYYPFPPRGRGYAPFTGGYRGRGAPASPFHGGRSSVKRLDNRPKRLAITGIEAGSPRDEALRQYLINVPDCTNIEQHPEQTNTLVITFDERYQAEMFLDDSQNIPDVGKLELSWIPNDAFGGITSTTAATDAAEVSDDDSSATIGDHDKTADAAETEHHSNNVGTDADMDVADDVDQWM